MHLVLGPERVDLRRHVVVLARDVPSEHELAGADVAWVDGHQAPHASLPFGADAATADDVHRLADAGAVAVGLARPTPATCAAAVAREVAVLVPAGAACAALDHLPGERLLVASDAPVAGAVACLDLADAGPAAWGRATVALAAGIRVVRTSEPRSIRRVATVVERLTSTGATP